MSKNQSMIRKAAEGVGLEVKELYWEPIGPALEMCGNSGGWTLITNKGVTRGYNAQEVLDALRLYEQTGIL